MRTFLFLGLFLSSCSAAKPPSSTAIQPTVNSQNCPEKPIGLLNSKNVKAIALSSQDTQESGMVKAGESVGFSFEAKGNEKFNYVTKDNLCVWIFSPENQVMRGTQLTQKGRYTLQVSVPTGSASFELAMRLEPPQPTSPKAVAAAPTQKQPVQIQERTERVSFAEGRTGTTIRDSVNASQLKHYLLQCGAGQSMTLHLDNSAVNLQVVDPNGNTIGRIANGASSWQGNLPSNGDYSLDVTSPSDSSFSIQVEVL